MGYDAYSEGLSRWSGVNWRWHPQSVALLVIPACQYWGWVGDNERSGGAGSWVVSCPRRRAGSTG